MEDFQEQCLILRYVLPVDCEEILEELEEIDAECFIRFLRLIEEVGEEGFEDEVALLREMRAETEENGIVVFVDLREENEGEFEHAVRVFECEDALDDFWVFGMREDGFLVFFVLKGEVDERHERVSHDRIPLSREFIRVFLDRFIAEDQEHLDQLLFEAHVFQQALVLVEPSYFDVMLVENAVHDFAFLSASFAQEFAVLRIVFHGRLMQLVGLLRLLFRRLLYGNIV